MNNLIVTGVLLSLTSSSIGVVFPNNCDQSMAVVSNFDMSMFSGDWYQVYSYKLPSEKVIECAKGSMIVEDKKIIFKSKGMDGLNKVKKEGTIDLPFNGVPKFDIKFTNEKKTSPFWVLDTDYKTYALVYSCENKNSDYQEVNSWIYSRFPYLNSTSVAPLDRAIKKTELLIWSNFKGTSHTKEACNGAKVLQSPLILLAMIISIFFKEIL